MKYLFKLALFVVLLLLLSACGEDASDDTNVDSTPPVITLNGASAITLNQGDTYIELGATAIDDVDGNIPFTITGTVDPNTPDSYTITYSATDSANNTGTATRIVHIEAPQPDTTPPVITLNGAATITLNQGDNYTEAGATATDDVDGNLTVAITGTVDTSIPGSYTITYTATDSANNTGTATRTVMVVAPDTTPPVITLNGPTTVTLNQGDTYVEQGATATDNVDGNIPVTITGSVDTSIPNSYTITYTATDSANNTNSLTRTVVVIVPPDITPPVITLNGPATVTLTQGDTYVEQGAAASDNVDGNLAVTITGSVDTSTPDTYTITYSATDSANNTGEATRTVIVFTSGTRPFITTWKTDNPGVSAFNQIKINTARGFTYDYTISWGDGQTDTNVTSEIVHTFATAGTYTITISGDFPGIVSGYNSDAEKLLSIEQWGDIKWQTMNHAFGDCTNLVINAADSPDLSLVSNMSAMFADASSINHDISSWDVSSVTDMSSMFLRATAFNQDLNTWNVSSVINMWNMFNEAVAFNQNLSAWDVSSVTNMGGMFERARTFNQDLATWNVSSVTNMSSMFQDAISFNQDLSTWDVSSVTDMSFMFAYADAFNQNLSTWNVSSITNMSAMFRDAYAFNQDLSAWNVSSVTDMSLMFAYAYAFNQNLSPWDVSSVTNMSHMFAHANAFNQDISTWNVSSVTNMSNMFAIHAFEVGVFNQDISSWNVSAVTDMSYMFYGADAFNQNISAWDVSSVFDMSYMFYGASIFNQDISSWNVSSAVNMKYMFCSTNKFNQNISNWDVSSVRNMNAMFASGKAFNQDISTWNVSSVTNMTGMFSNAFAFNQNLGIWDVSSVTNMSLMFFGLTLSPTNYDSLLQGWSTRNLKNGVIFDAGNSRYSVTSQAARDVLTGTFGWSIADGGLEP